MKKFAIEFLLPFCLFILFSLFVFDVLYLVSIIQNIQEMIYINKKDTILLFIQVLLGGFICFFLLRKIFIYWKKNSLNKILGISLVVILILIIIVTNLLWFN